MMTVGAFDAKTHLARLLDRVQCGEEVTITKRGIPVAKLIPAASPFRDRNQVIAELREFGKGRTLPEGLTMRDLIEEGRRF